MAIAAKPLDREAKHIFRPEAEPISEEIWVLFRIVARDGSERELKE